MDSDSQKLRWTDALVRAFTVRRAVGLLSKERLLKRIEDSLQIE